MSTQVPVLHTQRLTLTALNTSFCTEDYVNWMNDLQVNAFLETGGDYTLQQLRNYLEEVEKNPKLFWAILFTTSGKHIGNIKIDPVNRERNCGEYGMMIGDTSFWYKGLAKEASQAVIQYCFTQLGLARIELGVLENNHAAIALYRKLGFVVDSIYEYSGRHKHKCNRAVRMSLSANSWMAENQKSKHLHE